MSQGSQRVVIAALSVNLAIAAFKFAAALVSRSSAMLAEAGHSLADTVNQVFLLVGMRRSARQPDDAHPFGYGLESYFWSFMVALSIFTLGAGFSVHEGIEKIVNRNDPDHALGNPTWAFVALAVSIVLEGYSFTVAMKEFRSLARGRTIRQTLREARDPTVLTVLFEDLAALFGLVVALGGLTLSYATGSVVYDGAASIVVGVALAGVAWFLAQDTRSLLLGEGVSKGEEEAIRRIVTSHPNVSGIVHLRTMHLGPKEAIAAIKVKFRPPLDLHSLEERINQIEAALRHEIPVLHRIYIEPGFDERGTEIQA